MRVDKRLQWGRKRLSRAAKGRYARRIGGKYHQASMGPRLSRGAEGFLFIGYSLLSDYASMGPRRLSRGEGDGQRQYKVKFGKLQWGRGFSPERAEGGTS